MIDIDATSGASAPCAAMLFRTATVGPELAARLALDSGRGCLKAGSLVVLQYAGRDCLGRPCYLFSSPCGGGSIGIASWPALQDFRL